MNAVLIIIKKNFMKLGNILSAGGLHLKKLIKFFVDHLG